MFGFVKTRIIKKISLIPDANKKITFNSLNYRKHIYYQKMNNFRSVIPKTVLIFKFSVK